MASQTKSSVVEIEVWVLGERADVYIVTQTPPDEREEDDSVLLPKDGVEMEYMEAISGKTIFSVPEHIAHDLELDIAFEGGDDV